MTKKKYYVVWDGVEPGIYENWPEAQRQVKGHAGARFKSFQDPIEAREAFAMGYHAYYKENPVAASGSPRPASRKASVIGTVVGLPAWAVDAACSGVPGPMEYRGVDLATGDLLFHKGPYPDGTNNVGEFLALVHALALLEKKGDAQTAVYTDSRTALAWLRHKKAKTTLKPSRNNAPLFDLLRRAEDWLKTHIVRNPVLKWETEEWGEIPADFGRK
jgi:ribonuclease HI